jgi:hypothetical protein
MIEYVGRRPGEKLSEQLVMAHETAEPTDHSGIAGLRGEVPFSRPQLKAHFRHLQDLALAHETEKLRKALSEALPHREGKHHGVGPHRAQTPETPEDISQNGGASAPPADLLHSDLISPNGSSSNGSTDGPPFSDGAASSEPGPEKRSNGAADDRSNGHAAEETW